MKKEALRVSTTIPAAPTTLYLAWLNAEQHSAMTGSVAKIDSQVGGKYTALNGYVSGKLVILDLGRRLVMSWRTTDFPREDPDSRVEVHLEALGGSTRLTVLHTDIPEGQSEKYRGAWNEKYFSPMRTFFSSYLPDPRLPPPARRPAPPPDEDDEDDVEETPRAKKSKLSGKAATDKPKAVVGTRPAATSTSTSNGAVTSKAAGAPPKALPTKPAPSKPAPSKPAPSKPAPSKPAPSKPAAAKPAPSKPAAAKPAPSKPAAAKSKPGAKTAKAPTKKPAAGKPAAKKPAAKKAAKAKKK